MLKVERIFVRYGRTHAVQDVSLDVNEGADILGGARTCLGFTIPNPFESKKAATEQPVRPVAADYMAIDTRSSYST